MFFHTGYLDTILYIDTPGYLPVKNTGIDMKKPPTAHTLVIADFCRYLFVLKRKTELKLRITKFSCFYMIIVLY